MWYFNSRFRVLAIVCIYKIVDKMPPTTIATRSDEQLKIFANAKNLEIPTTRLGGKFARTIWLEKELRRSFQWKEDLFIRKGKSAFSR